LAFLRFTCPVCLPRRHHGGFEMVPARITLRAEEVLTRAAADCAHWRSRNPPLDSPRFKLVAQRFREAEELERACREGRDVEWAGDNVGLGWCSWLVLNRCFVRALCPVCGREYLPGQCDVRDWSLHGDPK